MHMLRDERGGIFTEYSLLALLIILSVGAVVWRVMRVRGLWAWAGQNLWGFLFISAAALGLGFVLGMLARGTGEERKSVQLVRAGEWELFHHVDMSGDMDITVHLQGGASSLAPWHVVGHCPRCGMPMFVDARDVDYYVQGTPPHVWRTCSCFTERKRRRRARRKV